MNLYDSMPPTPDPILAMIRGELSSRRRWLYRLILVVNMIVVAGILSLWLTEPGPLPLRLHVAFAAMSCIGMGWIGVLTWILLRRNCPTAFDRLATSWMALVACSLFLIVSLPIAWMRANMPAALLLGFVGFVLFGIACFAVKHAYSLRTKLRSKLAHLEAMQTPGC